MRDVVQGELSQKKRGYIGYRVNLVVVKQQGNFARVSVRALIRCFSEITFSVNRSATPKPLDGTILYGEVIVKRAFANEQQEHTSYEYFIHDHLTSKESLFEVSSGKVDVRRQSGG